MGAMKDIMMTLQQEFAEYKYIKDGCPKDEAARENWESMVKSFFDGDEHAALEEFQVWYDGRSARSLPDPTVNMNVLTQAMLSGKIVSFNTPYQTVCGKITGIKSLDEGRWIVTTASNDERGEDHVVNAG